MKRFLNKLSPVVEFLIVTGIAFGPFLLAEGLSLAASRSGPHHTSLSLLVLVAHDLSLAGCCSGFCAPGNGRCAIWVLRKTRRSKIWAPAGCCSWPLILRGS